MTHITQAPVSAGMQNAMLAVRPIQAHEWATYRDVRLRALQEAPDAFGSSFAAESMRSDEAWAQRILAATTSGKDCPLFAFDDKQVCGLIWCKLSTDDALRADLYQMWVAPEARGQGAGHALLKAALDWARKKGCRQVHLGVTAADSPALRLYQRHGFRAIGPLEPLREGSPLMAQAMVLGLPNQRICPHSAAAA